MNKKPRKKGSGGKRTHPLKYGEKTDTYAFRCPVSKICEMKEIIKDKLKTWEK